MAKFLNARSLIVLLILLGFLLALLFGETFYTRFATRMMIYVLVAISLDIILGYGGMVSFGHAAFFGVGAYTVAILAQHGVQSAFLVWPLAILFSAIAAALIGVISLRTSGVYFIMITLAFAQMLYYFFFSLDQYGGNDGLPLLTRNSFGGLFDVSRHTTFHYLVFAILILLLFLSHRLVHSHFGIVIRGIRENERRMSSIGFARNRYRLTAFVISGAMVGLAGALIANQTLYISPAIMHWTKSGEMLVMVILGGMRTLFGPVLGAVVFLLAEEILSSYTEHWMIIMGPFLLLVVLFARNGIYGLLPGEKEL